MEPSSPRGPRRSSLLELVPILVPDAQLGTTGERRLPLDGVQQSSRYEELVPLENEKF